MESRNSKDFFWWSHDEALITLINLNKLGSTRDHLESRVPKGFARHLCSCSLLFLLTSKNSGDTTLIFWSLWWSSQHCKSPICRLIPAIRVEMCNVSSWLRKSGHHHTSILSLYYVYTCGIPGCQSFCDLWRTPTFKSPVNITKNCPASYQ